MSDNVRDRRDVGHKSVLSGFESKASRGVYVPGNENRSGNVDAKCNVSCSNVYEEICNAIGVSADFILSQSFKVTGIYSSVDVFTNVLPNSSDLTLSSPDPNGEGSGSASCNVYASDDKVNVHDCDYVDYFSDIDGDVHIFYDAIRGFDRFSVYQPVHVNPSVPVYRGPFCPVVVGGVPCQQPQGKRGLYKQG